MDDHTRRWVDRVNRSGEAYLTPAMLDGRWMARISIGALPTERGHVERLWATMQQAVTRREPVEWRLDESGRLGDWSDRFCLGDDRAKLRRLAPSDVRWSG